MPEPDDASVRFEGQMIGVTVERWGNAEREIVERADSVAIVALDRAGNVILVRQFREAARRDLVELPAGTIDDGDEPLATARRELEEETGLVGGRWRPGPAFYTTPGFCRERVHLFFAEDLDEGRASPQGDEAIELVRVPAGEVRRRLGDLEDAKTVVGLVLYAGSRP